MAGPGSYPSAPALVEYPHPALRQKAETVTVFDDALRDFCHRMLAVMYAERGVGLAAPQVAVAKRIFVTDHARRKDGEEDRPGDPRIWINPRLSDGEGATVYEEGCLSFPGIYAKVTRFNRLNITWQDEWGVERRQGFDVEAGDFLGIVVQHEFDHLEGRVFLDHLAPAQFALVKRQVRQLEQDFRKATGRSGAVIRS